MRRGVENWDLGSEKMRRRTTTINIIQVIITIATGTR